jgi:hypothetical protein
MENHQCEFRRNRSTTDEIFFIRQILEKKWKYNETVHLLFMDFKKTCVSVKREVLYDILMECGVTMKLVRLMKICLNETYNEVCMGKYFWASQEVLSSNESSLLELEVGTLLHNEFNILFAEVRARAGGKYSKYALGTLFL